MENSVKLRKERTRYAKPRTVCVFSEGRGSRRGQELNFMLVGLQI